MRILLNQAKYYLDKPYIKVGYDPVSGVLFNIWNGFASFSEVLQIGQRTLEAALFEKPSKMLFDTRNMEVLDEESQQYVSNEFARQMRDIGIKFTATVLPEDEFAQYSVDRIKNAIFTGTSTEIRYFQQISSAIKWLKSK
jgi:hypothetical protein